MYCDIHTIKTAHEFNSKIKKLMAALLCKLYLCKKKMIFKKVNICSFLKDFNNLIQKVNFNIMQGLDKSCLEIQRYKYLP